MILFHGTDGKNATRIIEKGVDLKIGRNFLDFGRGFYLTKSLKQAIKWAGKFEASCVLEFNFDPINLNGKTLNGFSHDWGEIVYSNRILHKDLVAAFDFVEGKMADGFLKDLLKIQGKQLSKEEFLKAVTKDIGDQIVIKTSSAVKRLTIRRRIDSHEGFVQIY